MVLSDLVMVVDLVMAKDKVTVVDQEVTVVYLMGQEVTVVSQYKEILSLV